MSPTEKTKTTGELPTNAEQSLPAADGDQTEDHGYFDVNLQQVHVPRQMITLHLGPKGVPFTTMIDSGAARSMGKKASLIKAGLALVKLLQPLYMRLADDNVATKAIGAARP